MQGKNDGELPLLSNDIVTDNDILFGRGRRVENHPGNKMFREFIQQYSDVYVTASRIGKTILLGNLVQILKEKNVRMLRKRENEQWQQVNDVQMKHKIGHALRDSRKLRKLSKKIPAQAIDTDASGFPPQGLQFEPPFPRETSSEIEQTKKSQSTQGPHAMDISFSRHHPASWINSSPVLELHEQFFPHDCLVEHRHATTSVPTLQRGTNLGNTKKLASLSQSKAYAFPRLQLADSFDEVTGSVIAEPSESFGAAVVFNDESIMPDNLGFTHDKLETSVKEGTHSTRWFDVGLEGLSCTGVEDIFQDFVNSGDTSRSGLDAQLISRRPHEDDRTSHLT